MWNTVSVVSDSNSSHRVHFPRPWSLHPRNHYKSLSMCLRMWERDWEDERMMGSKNNSTTEFRKKLKLNLGQLKSIYIFITASFTFVERPSCYLDHWLTFFLILLIRAWKTNLLQFFVSWCCGLLGCVIFLGIVTDLTVGWKAHYTDLL